MPDNMINGPVSTSVDQRTVRQSRLNKLPNFFPGQKVVTTKRPQGGGGPENAGARTEVELAGTKRQAQPSWRFEYENDFIGFAGPSTNPDISGIPANNFRALGDNHGGRG